MKKVNHNAAGIKRILESWEVGELPRKAIAKFAKQNVQVAIEHMLRTMELDVVGNTLIVRCSEGDVERHFPLKWVMDEIIRDVETFLEGDREDGTTHGKFWIERHAKMLRQAADKLEALIK